MFVVRPDARYYALCYGVPNSHGYRLSGRHSSDPGSALEVYGSCHLDALPALRGIPTGTCGAYERAFKNVSAASTSVKTAVSDPILSIVSATILPIPNRNGSGRTTDAHRAACPFGRAIINDRHPSCTSAAFGAAVDCLASISTGVLVPNRSSA